MSKPVSPEYAAMVAAESGFEADSVAIETLEAAEAAYYGATKIARAAWEAFPEGNAKDSGDTNANDTCGWVGDTCDDELEWLRIALMSAEEMAAA